MENDNKKKKSKKKKNKQAAKNAEPSTAASTVAASVSADQIPNGFNQIQNSNAFEAECTAHPTADLDRHGVTTSDIDMELKFSKLHQEKEHWLQKEAILEERIKQFQMEKEEYINKEADLGLIISTLQAEKDSWLRREAGYEEKISRLIYEASTTSSKEKLLEERIKQLEIERESWAQEENSATETVAGLNADNTRLRSQVMELEESQKILFQENQQLLENISGLQTQIQNSAHLSREIREMENQHIKSEMLSAQTMVEKLLLENAELAKKLNAERDRQGTVAELSSSDFSGPVATAIKPTHSVEHSSLISDSTNWTAERVSSIPVAEYLALKADSIAGTRAKLAGEVVDDSSRECQPLLEEKLTPVEHGEVFLEEELCNHSNHNGTQTPDSEITVSTEIEQIPLEENEAASGTNMPVEDSSIDETSLVPISDAPLIGAPFRFISFMARYVSGADLVNQSS